MKMKKKLLFFITCFFLFSSLTAFFVYQRIRSPEVHKKENNEEVKKETNENLTTEKDNLDKEEENEDLPWTFTWKGALLSLILSLLIGIALSYATIIICKNHPSKTGMNKDGKKVTVILKDKNENTLSLLFWSSLPAIAFLYCFAFSAIFAIQKYKDKSYGERLYLINSSLAKQIFSGIFIVIVIIVGIISCCKDVESSNFMW